MKPGKLFHRSSLNPRRGPLYSQYKNDLNKANRIIAFNRTWTDVRALQLYTESLTAIISYADFNSTPVKQT